MSHLTSRQRLGIGIAKLSQERINRIIDNLATQAEAGDVKSIHALARLLDQAFGRAQEAQQDTGKPVDQKQWEEMTPEERASYRTALLEQQAREKAERAASEDASDPRGEA